ncbi:MAG: hypothetical protein A2868_01585 [Candidatus Levybacteria bacterium RIFCSPHIGHO2_01_FULL_40_15b]|nr:MAG: hypothetical protein A2868_01585 [Candidatus Levybacteria bacterium RIFCSPHIGHO2_01_FULL_40_15b]
MIDLPQLREGQLVRVFQKMTEGKRERNVPFIGKLLKVRGIGVNQTITIRQNLEGIDVDKIFPTALPTITKIEIVEQVKSLIKGQPSIRKKARKTKKATKSRRKKK